MPDDDFQIEIGEAVRRHILRRSNPLGDPGRVVVSYDSPDSDPIPVFVAEEVMQRMERQALGDKEREIGGVLLGGFYRNDDGSFVEITEYVEAGSARGTDVSLTFTHETWEYIHERIALLKDDSLQIVGWYHSHPGLGVFLSKDDEFIHTSYFSDPWHVAIVHDPIYTNWGCFKWADGELERAGGFYVYAEKSKGKQVRDYVKGQLAMRQAPPRSASHSADRLIRPSFVKAPSVWTAVIVMLLIQVLLGWTVLSKRGAGSQMNEYKTAVQLLCTSDLSGAEKHLRQELVIHPDNLQAYKDLCTLNRVLSSPSMASFRNEEIDRQNLILTMGNELAAKTRGKAQTKKDDVAIVQPGATENFRWGTKGMGVTADFAGNDPLKVVLDAYGKAAASRADRISRAKAVNTVATTWWSREAVQWVENEEFRQIAYGMASSPLEYRDRYKALKEDKRTIVDEVFGSKR